MKACILQHVPFEDLGSIGPWLGGQGAELAYTRFFEKPMLPGIAGLDLVVALGGPMSVNDEAVLPWLVDEKRFLRDAIAAGVPVLGICLGAQLIASALGARVYPGRHREIGWFDIEGIDGPGDRFRLPRRATVFHWHGETFELPPGAIHLARSRGCEYQAFQIGRRVIGLQFHLETTPDSAKSIISHCRDELIAGEFIQPEAELCAAPAARYEKVNRMMDEVLDYLLRRD